MGECAMADYCSAGGTEVKAFGSAQLPAPGCARPVEADWQVLDGFEESFSGSFRARKERRRDLSAKDGRRLPRRQIYHWRKLSRKGFVMAAAATRTAFRARAALASCSLNPCSTGTLPHT